MESSYFPLTFNKGSYAAIPNITTSAIPWSNGGSTYLMPTCKIGDKYYTFFGYQTTSPYSYQNQGAYSCDSYKSTAGSAMKSITPVYTSFLDKLKTYYGIDLPEYQNLDANNRVKPIFPLIQKTAPSGYSISTYYEIDWENTVYSTSSYIDKDGITGSYTATDLYIINPITFQSSDGGDTPTSDYSGIINAILMIPAVLLVLGVFTIIYRMFINRRVRG